jgi:predicted MFS family arabinose efflux permease
MSERPVSISEYWRLTRENRNFRRLWTAQIISEIGDWFYTLAIYSLLLEYTGKASSVALALILQVFPQVFVGPIAGVINDRVSRRKVMIASDLIRACIVGCMLLVRSADVVWLVYPLLFCETVMWSFFEPARSSVIPNVVEKDDVILANTLSSTTWSFNLAIGSTVGGIVAALLGRNAVFGLNAASFLVSAFLISRMRFVETHTQAHGPLTARELFNYTPILDGLRYIRSDIRLTAMVMAKSGVGLLGVSWVVFPIMGERTFNISHYGIAPERAALISMSILMGARGVGALLGPLSGARWAGRSQRRLRQAIAIGFAIGAAGYMILSAAPTIWIAAALIILAHSGTSAVWVFSSTLLQLNTDDRFRGRVFAAELGLTMLVLSVVSYIAGYVLDAGISPRTLVFGAGVFMLFPFAAWTFAQKFWREKPVTQAADSVARS